MGLYDEIKIEYPFPEDYKFLQNRVFQTKDFDRTMSLYRITSQGELQKEICEYQVVPEKERPFYGKPEWDKSVIYRFCGAMKKKHYGWEPMKYTGLFNCYDYIDSVFYDVYIKFLDGKLLSLSIREIKDKEE